METVPNEQPIAEEKAASKPPVLLCGVQFRRTSYVHTFSTENVGLAVGDKVMVETESGPALGSVVVAPHGTGDTPIPEGIKKILRRPTAQDLDSDAKRREHAMEFFTICREKIAEHKLCMKLVDADIEDGGKKAVFVFYAEQRVDFRGLVKDLATRLHMRIEMRQIGARDEAKFKGCIGPCGLCTCCSLHLRQFQSISISMAKHQGLAPNPAKLTGMCGKLKCCMAYEHDVYNEYRKGLPKIGSAVSSPEGSGKVVGHNVLKRECTVRLFGGGEFRCPCESCKPLSVTERDEAIAVARKQEEDNEERSRRKSQRREKISRKR